MWHCGGGGGSVIAEKYKKKDVREEKGRTGG